MSNSILLHSGGLDSTLLGATLRDSGENFISVFVNFASSEKTAEMTAVQRTSGLLGVKLDVIDASGLKSAYTSSPSSPLQAMPNPGAGVLKLGSALLYGIVFPYALQRGLAKIYVGLTKLDAEFSQEYSKSFLKAYSAISTASGNGSILIEAPFVDLTKADVLKKNEKHLSFIGETWSCIYSNELHCGCCDGCRSRITAFSKAKLKDTTKYFRDK